MLNSVMWLLRKIELGESDLLVPGTDPMYILLQVSCSVWCNSSSVRYWLHSILMITATLFFRQPVTRFFPVLFVMNIFDEKYCWIRKKIKIIKTVTITVNIDFIQFSCFAGVISRSFVITEVVIVNSSLTFISHMPIE